MQIKSRAYQRAALLGEWNHTVAGNYSGPAFGMHAHLATAFAATPSDRTVWADVTEATYHGYLVQAMVLPTGTFDTSGGPQGICGLLTWQPSDGAVPEVIVGIVYTDNAVGGNVLGIDVLPNPIAMADEESGFASITVLDLPWQTNGTPAVVIS